MQAIRATPASAHGWPGWLAGFGSLVTGLLVGLLPASLHARPAPLR